MFNEIKKIKKLTKLADRNPITTMSRLRPTRFYLVDTFRYVIERGQLSFKALTEVRDKLTNRASFLGSTTDKILNVSLINQHIKGIDKNATKQTVVP